jgi:glucose/arabinose dehydrogenase
MPCPTTPRLASATGLVALLWLSACVSGSPTPGAASERASAAVSPSGGATRSAGATASADATRSPAPAGDADAIALELVTDGLADPIGITAAGDGSGRLFVNERTGEIRVVEADGSLRAAPFVDLSNRVLAGGERGLLGVAFHPDFAENRRLFVHYSRGGDGATVVSELHAAADLQSADPASERVLLTVSQPYANHNGGQLAFGPDGYLYLGLGDGGGAADPLQNAQNPNVLLGKILRLDVDAEPDGRRAYALPPDNAFGPRGPRPAAGLPEIWALGLRNPWRFSFDSATGDLYIGDVGQGRWEEIDRQPAGAEGGANYGWNRAEGRHCFLADCDLRDFVGPVAEYPHEQGSCSVTGGHVYRGSAQPALAGTYLFGDYCSGLIYTLHPDRGRMEPRLVLRSELSLSSFGEGEDGEIYVADIRGGGIYHVVAD